MILAASHPEDPEIILHAWVDEEEGDVRPVLGAVIDETTVIPASWVRKSSRGEKARRTDKPKWKLFTIVTPPDVVEVRGDIGADMLRKTAVYASEFIRMLRSTIGGPAPRTSFRILVFADRNEFCKHATRCGASNALSFYDPRTALISMWVDDTVGNAAFQRLLAHEMTHAYMDLVWGRTEPLWFAEGMAEYFSNFIWKRDHAEPGAVDFRQLELLWPRPAVPLSELVSMPREIMYRSPEFPRFYAQAWSFVHSLFEHDPEAVAELLRTSRVTGIEELEETWLAHLQDLRGGGALYGSGMSDADAGVWHTDIVVDGQGFNVRIEPEEGFWVVYFTPDTPGSEANEALSRFAEILGFEDEWEDLGEAKRAVENAVETTGARWNGWHKEAYEAA